jgi:hypothetical protein
VRRKKFGHPRLNLSTQPSTVFGISVTIAPVTLRVTWGCATPANSIHTWLIVAVHPLLPVTPGAARIVDLEVLKIPHEKESFLLTAEPL